MQAKLAVQLMIFAVALLNPGRGDSDTSVSSGKMLVDGEIHLINLEDFPQYAFYLAATSEGRTYSRRARPSIPLKTSQIRENDPRRLYAVPLQWVESTPDPYWFGGDAVGVLVSEESIDLGIRYAHPGESMDPKELFYSVSVDNGVLHVHESPPPAPERRYDIWQMACVGLCIFGVGVVGTVLVGRSVRSLRKNTAIGLPGFTEIR